MAKIDSWGQLQEQVASILEHLHARPALALAAAANPIYALQEMGHEIGEQAAAEIDERLRFGPRQRARLRELREAVFKEAGHPFDLNSPEELRRGCSLRSCT
jgi:hypothetical protein